MRSGGRAAAAMEVLNEIADRHRPAADALKDWGKAHRFAGAGDRAAIGNLVYDVLRRRALLAHAMDDEAPRALVLAELRLGRGLATSEIARLGSEEHGFGALSPDESQMLDHPATGDLPAWAAGSFPEWLLPSFERAFGARAAEEGAALARRAPVDLRANALKADRDKVLKALAKFGAAAGPLSPWCVRIAPPEGDGRTPNVAAEPAHGKGWFEVQDEGSQVAALLAGAKAGMQVADICAGGGGKTLALAAAMGNKGQIFAHDSDRHRLRPIFERLKRAGVRNVQVIPADAPERLRDLAGAMDLVLVDAPCSGSGAWRRKPDAKWRLTLKALANRIAEQRAALEEGARLVKPGGRLVYVTCSVLPEENGDQVRTFLAARPSFQSVPYTALWSEAIGSSPPPSAGGPEDALLLTPAKHGTDGFFVAILRRLEGAT